MLARTRVGFRRFTIGVLFALSLCLAGGLLTVMHAQGAGGDGPPATQAAPASQSGADYADGEVLVRLKAGASMSSKKALAGLLGSATFRDLGLRAILPQGERILLFKSTALPGAALVKIALQNPNVIAASLNYRLYAAAVTPNDPDFTNLWGLNNTGQTGGTAGADISASAAWSTTTGSSGVVVADIDTGVAYDHVDLAANMWHNPDEIPANGFDDDLNGYVDDVYGINAITGSGDPYDDHGHGTHTAGTMAAVGNNGIGVTGVAWQARIMALKFLPAAGSGLWADAITCIDYVVDEKLNHGVNVVAINASWGGTGFSSLLRDAIDAAGAADIVFVAAAGNNGTDNDAAPLYPAAYDSSNIIAVAATDHNDALAAFSNFGATSVDLAAPGVGILSTVPGVGVDLYAAAFSDATHGWAVGSAGAIPATTDGGGTWSAQDSGSQASLYGVAFSDATHGWAVGTAGAILATTDGGATWSAESSGSSAWLTGVDFTDATHGWAVGEGGTILATTNGGATWSAQSSGSSVWLLGVAFSDVTHGWAVGNGGTILATTNGGATWSAQSSGISSRLDAVAFSDATHGLTVGNGGTILATTDGGATWSAQSSGSTAWLTGVSFTDATHGWTVGNGGTILATTDGGATWSAQSSGSTAWLYGVAFSDATHGWTVGDSGTILATADGGATWSAQSLGGVDWYANWDGTSMATPHVTGAVALCAAQFPLETVAQRVQRILDTVDPIASLSGMMTTGGRLDVAAAVNHVAAVAITVTAPNGGESWANGSAQNLDWTVNPAVSVGAFNAWLIDGVGNWVATVDTVAAVPGQATYSVPWTVSAPALPDYRLTVWYRPDAAVWGGWTANDQSDADFEVTGTPLTVTAPDGGESWANGAAQNLDWFVDPAVSVGAFNAWLIDGVGNWVATVDTVAVVPGQATYSVPWTVSAPARADYKLTVWYRPDASVWGGWAANDQSDADFEVTGAPLALTVTAPNGGESWANGSAHNLDWTLNAAVSAGAFNVWLIDGVGNWVTTVGTVAAVPAQATYSVPWTVSAPARPDYRLTVWYRPDAAAWGGWAAHDQSDATFTVTAP